MRGRQRRKRRVVCYRKGWLTLLAFLPASVLCQPANTMLRVLSIHTLGAVVVVVYTLNKITPIELMRFRGSEKRLPYAMIEGINRKFVIV